jgi:hypothetical protein
METLAESADNLFLLRDYLHAIEAVNENPADESAVERLHGIDEPFIERFSLFPRYDYEPGGKRRTVSHYEPVTLADGIESVRSKLMAGEYTGLGPLALARQSRGTIIHIGKDIAISGALDRKHFQAAYDLIDEALPRLNDNPAFTAFARKRMRNDLWQEYALSRQGWKTRPISPDDLEANIREAMKHIGYPLGWLGKLSVSKISASLVPRLQERR